MPASNPSSARSTGRSLDVFAGAVGVFLALALLKLGNPVILDHKLDPPGDILEFLIWSWPVAWGYALLAVLVVWGMRFVRRPTTAPAWLIWLPLIWLGWQCLSAAQTVRWSLTAPTLKHFTATVFCFYLGLLALGKAKDLTPLWWPLLVGFAVVMAVGFHQHFGGLESTRQFVYSQPGWERLPAAFLQKIASERIYATLFYPNTLAGVILLFAPMLIGFALASPPSLGARRAAAGAITLAALGCLYWSGSKAGWLIALVVALVAWMHSQINSKLKWVVMAGLLVAGLGGFVIKYMGYLEKGAQSLGARFDYWQAALHITFTQPILGSGPGTFSVLYRHLKPTDAEMARLAHNDYLQQASDSGLPGFALYAAIVVGCLVLLYSRPDEAKSWLRFGMWLGLLGWALQGMTEFNLYVPALAWPAFLLLGWLCATRPAGNASTIPSPLSKVGRP